MRYFITLFLILFLALNAVALSEQEYFHTRDSLQNILDHSAGIDRADAIFNLVRFVAYYEPGICDSLIAEEAALAEKYNDTNGLAGTHQNRGDLFYYSNNFSGALENYYNAARLFEEVGNYREAARSYLRVIIVFYFTGNKNKFVGYYQKIIDLYQKCGCSEDLAFFYYLLGFLYNHGDTQPLLAKQYLRKAIGIGEATQMPPIYLAGFNSSLSLACCNQQQYDSAIRYLYKSNSFLNDNSEDVMLHKAINVADLAKVYYLSGNNDSAMYYYKNGIAKAQELSYRFTITRCARGIAKILISENRNEEAVEYYKLAINNVMKINASGQYYASPDKKYDSEWLADAWPGNIKIFSENPKKLWAKGEAALVCYELSALLKSIDQQGEALEYFELYHAFSDTLRQIEKARELINLELGYETEIKDRKIENLSQENQLNQLKIRQSRFFLFGLAGI
nr:hypothetical protein [Bacteroidota bacterium]